MSQQYSNLNSGAAFINDTVNPKAPAFKGTLNVEGKDYAIAIWKKTSKAGKKFLSLKVEEPRNKSFTPKQDDDIDF